MDNILSSKYRRRQYTATTGAIDIDFSPANQWFLKEVRVHLGTAGNTGNLTITVDDGTGATYDTVLVTQDMTGKTDFVYVPEEDGHYFFETDTLKIDWANSANYTYGVTVIYQAV